jgi:hypothetical protein
MITERIYPDVPNVAFRAVVVNYAFFAGRPVFTLNQQFAALINYIEIAKRLN